ncbi:MAG: hypothetical protein AABP62_13285 [Planctomycetota bacterium]
MTITTRDPIVAQARCITGNAYLGLLDLARQTESLVGLVWREQLKFSPSAQQIAADLKPSLVEERLTDEWPGTRLFGSQAWYRLYRCDEHSLPIFSRVERLDGWLAPDFPEDISYQLPTGECWLISVAHEPLCWLFPEVLGDAKAGELDCLLKAV